MDGIANVARQQQSQMSSENNLQAAQATENQTAKVDVVKELQKESSSNETKINSKEQVEKLVDDLNKTIAPMNTNLKFGVDRDDIFYVSVIDTETSRVIRRFPAEKAAHILPKMQEVTGILFDSKG